MANSNFTEEQISILEMSPYVCFASSYQVTFTEEFKTIAYEERRKGKRLRDIFHDYGIDPDMLGQKRIQNFSQMLNKRSRKGADFSDLRKNNAKSIRSHTGESIEEQVKTLQHELAYARQEIEFLKKLQMANMEAERQWESKPHQK